MDMVTKDDAMEYLMELEDLNKVLKDKLDAKTHEALADRFLAIKKYVRNSQNIIVPAVK
jgi:hypothetical protein